jgi:4-alpha-glucanotransferase
MKFPRRSGLILHPTSLPGPYGIGELGAQAFQFIDFLSKTEQTYWQLLPLTPVDSSYSPYQGLSAFAGNPLLISLDNLVKDGYLSKEILSRAKAFNPRRVQYKKVQSQKNALLTQASQTFFSQGSEEHKKQFNQFCQQHAFWLEDFVLFMALLGKNRDLPWYRWPEKERLRDPTALQALKNKLSPAINKHKFWQWCFFKQWFALRTYANDRGIQIIGDIPIFVSMNSADVWANTHLFYFDKNLNPLVVSGVPPDYFSETGQLWGHPLYRWDKMAEKGYRWWIDRFRMMSQKTDIVRIDHFRAMYNYWEVPANETTAINGRWLPGPGADLFHAVTKELSDISIIAEDLGDFDDESRKGVDALQTEFGYPGMKIVQFAFSNGPENPFLPHNHPRNCIAYTGTHDNDTIRGWYEKTATEHERHYARKYMDTDGKNIAWRMIRLTWSSPAHTAITTVQDILNLGHKERMNTPSTLNSNNWSWRLDASALTDKIKDQLLEITEIYGRKK